MDKNHISMIATQLQPHHKTDWGKTWEVANYQVCMYNNLWRTGCQSQNLSLIAPIYSTPNSVRYFSFTRLAFFPLLKYTNVKPSVTYLLWPVEVWWWHCCISCWVSNFHQTFNFFWYLQSHDCWCKSSVTRVCFTQNPMLFSDIHVFNDSVHLLNWSLYGAH